MSKTTLALSWIISTVLAFAAGWLSGLSNATRVAGATAHIMTYLFIGLLILIVAAAGYLTIRSHNSRSLPS